ncbi:hypothetical protein VTK73DRAFT_173 [Phialemonium thermophilum]|uniref:Serine hydrolase domain-containing protein n=1 Tax=Phialemonium thermophilum TaxID=223376 RepID=A0ABR3VWL4_9PEZI
MPSTLLPLPQTLSPGEGAGDGGDAHLPRLLCLHGGGTTARIFRRQCRSLVRAFSPYFRLVFADAPYLAPDPGPDAAALAAVYPPARYGPFRRWLRSSPSEHPICDADGNECEEGAAAIERAMLSAMAADDAAGGRGEWVGLLGFSQGAKVAASVLFETQGRLRGTRPQVGPFAGVDWRFGVLLAGRGPLVALGQDTFSLAGFERPGGSAAGRTPPPPPPVVGERRAWNSEHRIWLPTVHVHGLGDPGLAFHRALHADGTQAGSAELVEWDGDHRVAIQTKDVQRIVQAVLRAAQRAGVEVASTREPTEATVEFLAVALSAAGPLVDEGWMAEWQQAAA